MIGRRRKFLRCKCSKIASVLILSLFLRVKILHLAHQKFTFLLFRSNYGCLFSDFVDVSLFFFFSLNFFFSSSINLTIQYKVCNTL